MPNAVILDAVRSPMGRSKPAGALASLHPVDSLAQVLTALIDRTGIDPGAAAAFSSGASDGMANSRQAWLAAGYPVHISAPPSHDHHNSPDRLRAMERQRPRQPANRSPARNSPGSATAPARRLTWPKLRCGGHQDVAILLHRRRRTVLRMARGAT
jgi:hypothetical protein